MNTFLSSFNLFKNLTHNELDFIASVSKNLSFSKDTVICNKGELGDSVFLIKKGKVKVYDNEYVFAEIGKNNIFGEYAFLDSQTRSATVTALEDSIIYEISRLHVEKEKDVYLKVVNNLIFHLTQRLRNHNELEQEIVKAKDKIAKQNKNINESILCAKRIQDAALPEYGYIKGVIPNAFVLFKPKDIVSGDFYWIGENNAKKIIVAADCTGHGVPGAFMSMLGVSLLNDI